jgi:hypothetical protein
MAHQLSAPPLVPISDPPDRTGILGHPRIGGKQRNAFDGCLCDQHAVEGVLVKGRQAVDGNRMFARDWQFTVPVVEQAATKQTRVNAEIIAP